MRIKAYNPLNISNPTALLDSFTVQYSKWTTDEDYGLIANTTEYRYSISSVRDEVTFGILNYGYSAEKLGSLDKGINTRYYNNYDDVKQFIATNFQYAQNPNEQMKEILLFYDNNMPETPWKNKLPQPYNIDNFDTDGYLCGFISIKGYFTLHLYGDTSSSGGTALYERYYEPAFMYSNAIVGAGMIDLIAEESSTEHIYDIVIAIPINQDNIGTIKNQYGGAFFDIYHSEYGAFYDIYAPAYDNGYNAGVTNAVDTDFVQDLFGNHFRNLTSAIDSIVLIDEGGLTISIWDIFITLVVILVFIAFLKIYLGG